MSNEPEGEDVPRCGDAGGVTVHDRPCRRRVAEPGDRCPDHPQEEDLEGGGPPGTVEREDEKKHALQALRDYPEKRIEGALAAYGEENDLDMPGRTTVWRWTKLDESFADAWEDAKDARTPDRFEAVRDSLIERVIAGKATGAETIFTMVNLARQVGEGDKWQDLRKHDVSIHGDRIPVDAADRVLEEHGQSVELPPDSVHVHPSQENGATSPAKNEAGTES